MFDYENNITIKRNKKGEITIKTTDAIFNVLVNNIYASSQYYAEQGFDASEYDTQVLWKALIDKEDKVHHE